MCVCGSSAKSTHTNPKEWIRRQRDERIDIVAQSRRERQVDGRQGEGEVVVGTPDRMSRSEGQRGLTKKHTYAPGTSSRARVAAAESNDCRIAG